MTPTRLRISDYPRLAAVLFGIAAFAVLGGWHGPAVAADAEATARPLAIELRVALADLRRLDAPDVSATNAEGLLQRIRGSLGLLPWYLVRDGQRSEAAVLSDWVDASLGTTTERALLDDVLAALVERVPLDLAARAAFAQPGDAVAEAAALHESYCAGCHDDAGAGDPDLPLPARDLRLMAREEPGDVFLSRLALGIKGDETIAFRSPVTDRQLLALYDYYRSDADD